MVCVCVCVCGVSARSIDPDAPASYLLRETRIIEISSVRALMRVRSRDRARARSPSMYTRVRVCVCLYILRYHQSNPRSFHSAPNLHTRTTIPPTALLHPAGQNGEPRRNGVP